jgi:NADP-dependent 3-hydroxy acid dehydrogenase YdfG/pimeloyl-ACP methyl ester carboxylesterase
MSTMSKNVRSEVVGSDRLVDDERMIRVARDMELCCRIAGDPDQPAVLLIAGLGQQLNEWPAGLVDGLLAEGFQVIRFDNRDVGRSSRAACASPTPSAMLSRRFRAEQYTLGDMAMDTVGLLDGLGIEAAHVVGMSMGGMIGQTLAARFPARVLTLTSIMSNTGARRIGRPTLSTWARLLKPEASTREGFAEQSVAMMRHIGSHGFPFDSGHVRALALEAWDRGGGANPDGAARQLAAIFKSGDRTREIRGIKAPTLVIHGDRDRMVNPTGGRATVKAIPGARLLTIAGMGHDLPTGAVPRLVEAIAGHAREEDRAAARSADAPEPRTRNSARRRQVPPLAGQTVVISGAASGIGRALAQRLSDVGCPVAILDADGDGLQETVASLRAPVLAEQIDVRDRQRQLAFAAEVAEWAPAPIGAVFNNAGVAVSAAVADEAIEDDLWLHAINFDGVVHGVRAFLPILLAQGSGAIVNTSSVYGLAAVPYHSAYCASKFAVRGFTESLRHELAGTGVRAVTVHPGGVRTNIARSARVRRDPRGRGRSADELADEFEAMVQTTPERAAEIIHNGVDAGKSRILVGADAQLYDIAARLAPTRYWTFLAQVERLAERSARKR